MTILTKRTNQIKDNYDNLGSLEDIYCKICYDFGLISDEMIESLRTNRDVRKKLKTDLGNVSMAHFVREYELSDEFLILKSCKYQLEALGRLMSGLKMRIESLRAEAKGGIA
jgi:hypothetical protein